jgi:hypothetical protein
MHFKINMLKSTPDYVVLSYIKYRVGYLCESETFTVRVNNQLLSNLSVNMQLEHTSFYREIFLYVF